MAAYGLVDGKNTLLSNWHLMSVLLGIVFFGFGAVSAVRAAYINEADAFAVAAGSILAIVGIYQFILQRRVGGK